MLRLVVQNLQISTNQKTKKNRNQRESLRSRPQTLKMRVKKMHIIFVMSVRQKNTTRTSVILNPIMMQQNQKAVMQQIQMKV